MTGFRRTLLASLALVLSANLQALSLSGRVVDGAKQTPIADAIVVAGHSEVRTDSNGHYQIEVAEGTTQLGARAVGYTRTRIDIPASGAAPDITLSSLHPKGLYLSVYGIGSKTLRTRALDLIESTELNALVIDVKGDRGLIGFDLDVPLAQQIGARTVTTVHDMPALIQQLKQRDIYLIARIVVFKDDLLAAAKPDLAVKTAGGGTFRDNEKLRWVDASQQQVWQYNLDIAEQAAKLGFDEIQFDYVRFPDKRGVQFSIANNEENRVKSISGFLAAARERLRPHNVFVAADLFGYIAWNQNDTDIGQTLAGTVPHLDYLCPMLYPSGFQFGIPGYRNPVANSYKIVNLTLKRAGERSGISPLRYRPWLQSFKDYAFDRRKFGAGEIGDQIKAAEDFGSSGWLLWNPRNVYSDAGLKAQ